MKNRRLMPTEHDLVLAMAESGISIARISRSLQVPPGAVSKVIREKYPNHNERKILPIKTIVSRYKAGETMEHIADSLNTTSNTIKSRLISEGVEIRTISEIQRIHFFNDSYFKKIDTPDKAYWLGFIFADGCVMNNRLDVQISLASKDRGHLEKFLRAIDYEGPGGISDYVGSGYGIELEYSRVLLRSPEMNADLISLGCMPNKSLDLGPPLNMPKDFRFDFIRGLVDGDGYVSKAGPPSLEIVGAHGLLEWVSSITGMSEPRPHKNIWRIRCSGEKALVVSEKLYGGASVYLDRKMERVISNAK